MANNTVVSIDNLINLFELQITAYLKWDSEELKSPPLSDVSVRQFIAKHADLILIAANKMYKSFQEEDDLESLINPEADWIREFIFNGGKLEDALNSIRY
jgi:hypothetical protein